MLWVELGTTGTVRVNCSEMPPAWALRHPELGARPWPEPACSHFMPVIVALCSSSCAAGLHLDADHVPREDAEHRGVRVALR